MHGIFTVKVKSSFLCPRREMEEPSVKYILLRDRVGHTVEKNLLSLGLMTKSTPWQVLRGEILEGVPEAEQPTDLTKVAFVGIERKSLRLECRTEDLTRLSEEEANLLLAITSSEGRYQTFIDRKRLAFGGQLLPGSAVFVEVKGMSKVLPGVVWYKGELPPSLGIWFGVELIKNPGSGTCDGKFRNKHYFTCARDSGVFVGLDKLTPREDEDEDDTKPSKIGKKDENKLKSSLKDSILSFWKGKHEQRSFQGIDGVLKTDERVVTFINDTPARGNVRYIAEEKDSMGNSDIIVGLELDERMGFGCGKRFGSQKFVCKRDYAAFVPWRSVMPEKDFDKKPERATRQEAQGKKEQTHEGESYPKSMSHVNLPSGTRKESVRKLRRTNSMTSAETELIVAAGESSKTNLQEYAEKQYQMFREFEGKNIPGNQDNDVTMQDEERTDSAENFHFKDDHFKNTPQDRSVSDETKIITGRPGLSNGNLAKNFDHQDTTQEYDSDYVNIGKDGSQTLIGKHEQHAILKIKEMEAYLSRGLLKRGEWNYMCQFLGSQEVVMGPGLEAVCAQVFKKYAELTECFSSGMDRLHINLENVTTKNTSSWLEHPIKKISFITQDPDHKSIFGYVCSGQRCRTGYKLFVYQSKNTRDIIQIFNKVLEVATNTQERPDNFCQERNDQRPTKEREQERNVYRSVRALEEQVTQSEAELREKELRENNLHEQLREKEQREESLRRRLYQMKEPLKNRLGQLHKRNEQLRAVTQEMTVVQGQLQEKHEETANLQGQATALELRENNLQEQLREREQREENLRRQLYKMEQRLTNLRGQSQERNEQLRDVTQQMTIVRGQLQEKDEETANLQNQLEGKDQEMIELETTLSTVQEETANLQNQAAALRRQLEKKDQEIELQQTNLRGQLQERNEQLRNVTQQMRVVQGRLQEKDEETANLQNQLEEKDQVMMELETTLSSVREETANLHNQLEEKDQVMIKLKTTLFTVRKETANLQNQLEEKDQVMTELETTLSTVREETANLQNQAAALKQQLEEKDQEIEKQQTNLRGQLQDRNEQLRNVTWQMRVVQGRLQEKDEETANLQNQLEEKDQEMIELETTLSTVQEELRDYQRQQSPEWVISRDHIQLNGKFLGRGGWGSVVEGKYCGCSVAVKQIHELILSPHNRKLFEREMDIASRCRHPCLLQFIGATNDEGNPLFVTELMETSLRTLLEQRALSEVEISFISLDVARALSYLHQKQPSPIIHRDISSANVLLWRQGEHWRGKVSDYGTANFMQQTMTVAPGAVIYSAPEAFTKKQTVKVDVYSFGVLLCEMCIRELPDPQKRVRQVAMVKNKLDRALIRRCLQSEPEPRPSIQEIIDELEEPN